MPDVSNCAIGLLWASIRLLRLCEFRDLVLDVGAEVWLDKCRLDAILGQRLRKGRCFARIGQAFIDDENLLAFQNAVPALEVALLIAQLDPELTRQLLEFTNQLKVIHRLEDWN